MIDCYDNILLAMGTKNISVSVESRTQIDIVKLPIGEDFSFMMKVFQIAQLFGLTPSTSGRTEKSLGPKIVGVILVLSLLILSFFSLFRNVDVIMSYHTTIAGVMLVMLAAEIVFVSYSIISLTFCQNENWRHLFIRIRSLQRKIDSTEVRSLQGKQYSLYIRVVLINSVMMSLLVARYYFWFKYSSFVMMLLNSTNAIAGLYIIIIITQYIAFTNWLRNRIDDTNKYLKSLNESQDGCSVVKTVADLCNMVHGIMERFNSIFGRIVFYEICICVLNLLYTFSYAVDDHETEQEHRILNFLKPISYAVPITVLIMSCDSVEESGKEIMRNVYILHETIENPKVKDELLLLAQCEEHWRPIFSAAGFFEVNQSCIASIFSALITYIVIIIQFNMVLQDDATSDEDKSTNMTTIATT